MDKKKNYQKKVGKPAQKANIVSTKKKSEPRKVTKADIDFNTNIFKQFCEQKEDKIITPLKSVELPNNINPTTEFPQIEKKPSFKKEVDNIQNIQNLINEYNSSIESKQKQNDENNSLNNNINIQNNTITQTNEVNNNNKENIERNFIKDTEEPQKISTTSNMYVRQLSYQEKQELNEKVKLRKKQEEYRKMLDEQNELNRRYREKAKQEKEPLWKESVSPTKSAPFNPPMHYMNGSIPNNSEQIQQSVDVNNMQKYQEILNEFCDIKTKVINEVNSLKQQQMIQKYQNILNSFIDSKINHVNEEMKQRLMSEEAHKIEDNINYNNLNDNNQEIERDKNVEEVTPIHTTEEVKREPIIIKQKNTNSKIKEYINRDKEKIKEKKKVKPQTANAVQKIVIKPEKRKIKTSNEKKRVKKISKEDNIKEGKDNPSNWDFINSNIKKNINKSEIEVKPISQQPKTSIALKDSLDVILKTRADEVTSTNNNQEEVINKLENIQKYVMNLLSNYKEDQ